MKHKSLIPLMAVLAFASLALIGCSQAAQPNDLAQTSDRLGPAETYSISASTVFILREGKWGSTGGNQPMNPMLDENGNPLRINGAPAYWSLFQSLAGTITNTATSSASTADGNMQGSTEQSGSQTGGETRSDNAVSVPIEVTGGSGGLGSGS